MWTCPYDLLGRASNLVLEIGPTPIRDEATQVESVIDGVPHPNVIWLNNEQLMEEWRIWEAHFKAIEEKIRKQEEALKKR